MIVIDGINMPTPSSFRMPMMDIDSEDTKRNELGYMQRDRIRQGIRKFELEYKGITSEQLVTIATAVKPEKVSVTFLRSPWGEITLDMYVGDRIAEIVKYDEDYNKMYWKYSFNLVEF